MLIFSNCLMQRNIALAPLLNERDSEIREELIPVPRESFLQRVATKLASGVSHKSGQTSVSAGYGQVYVGETISTVSLALKKAATKDIASERKINEQR
jgi:hypothetical protein